MAIIQIINSAFRSRLQPKEHMNVESASSLKFDSNSPFEQVEVLTHDWQKKFRIGVMIHVAKAGLVIE